MKYVRRKLAKSPMIGSIQTVLLLPGLVRESANGNGTGLISVTDLPPLSQTVSVSVAAVEPLRNVLLNLLHKGVIAE